MEKVEIISLDGEWTLIHREKKIRVPTAVPGSVFEALIDNDIVEDPFYGLNERDMKWVYESDWVYETEFDISQNFLKHSSIILRFNGLDTISDVTLNGEHLGLTNNMFIRYEFKVKTLLKNENNKLIIKFKSPTKKARESAENYGFNLNTGYAAIPGVPYLRKAQYSFGWDWGPRLPDIGIWQSVELVGFDNLRIDSIYLTQNFDYNKDPSKIEDLNEVTTINAKIVDLRVKINLISKLEISDLHQYQIEANLKGPDGIILTTECSVNSLNPSVKFEIEYPYLWWTHDLGTPNLYDLMITVKNDDIVDSYSQKIGIRDIQLIRNSDKWGETFYFLLNGVPIFAKGANWIPIDSFIPRGKKKGLYSLNLNLAKEAYMNMIRVWGGGIYEDDLFYQICDNLGILVWQDFPFACAIYPPYDEFIESFEIEAIQNIERLRNHPSLAFWCGNNEIEWLWNWELKGSGISDDATIGKFKSFYRKKFEILLPKLIEELDPNRPYWPSSPSNGYVGEKIGSINSNSPDKGDSHYWDVWHRNKPFRAYRRFNSRFMSEFGFESFPSIKTIETFCPIEQYDFFSEIMENHQKNSAGNEKILNYMKKRFTIPNKFENQVLLSQITQAEAIEYGVEHWRRNRNDFHCMGSLYWQLNDCWPVASWSSIDYYGRWKALHSYAKRFYNPLFPSVVETEEYVEFWVTNDYRTQQEITLKWKIYNSNGEILKEDFYEKKILPCSSSLLTKEDLQNINIDKEAAQNTIIFYTLIDGNNVKYHGFRLFNAPKKFSLKNPHISWKLEEALDHETNEIKNNLVISSKEIALYVFIESNKYDFIAEDNYFAMEPGETRTIKLQNIEFTYSSEPDGISINNEDFAVKSLFDLITNDS